MDFVTLNNSPHNPSSPEYDTQDLKGTKMLIESTDTFFIF